MDKQLASKRALILCLAFFSSLQAQAASINLKDGLAEITGVFLPASIGINGPGGLQIGVPVAAKLAASDGLLSQVNGKLHNTLKFHSEGAKNLSLRLDDVYLPEGVEITIESADGSIIQGPFKASNVGADNRLYTPMVSGDAAILKVKGEKADRARYKVTQVFHGALNLDDASTSQRATSGAFGSAASCEIDVACPDGAAWSNNIRSVVELVINGTTVCTGTLVNTSAEDLTPVILTASHCGFSFNQPTQASEQSYTCLDGTTINNVAIGAVDRQCAEKAAASVVVYYQYQNASCGSRPAGNYDLSKNQLGTTLLSSMTLQQRKSDHTLLALNAPVIAGANAYFAGIDGVTNVAPGNASSGVDIHHPAGDVKKISVIKTVATTTGFNWNVTWNKGITEGGSSGSGLLNASGQIYGVLTAGGSSCATPNASDTFGMTSYNWSFQPNDMSLQLKNRIDNASRCTITTSGRDGAAAGTPVASTCSGGAPAVPTATLSAPTTANVGDNINLVLTLQNAHASARVNQVIATIPAVDGLPMSQITAPTPSSNSDTCGYGSPVLNASTGALSLRHYSVKQASSCAFTIPMNAQYAGSYTVSLPANTIKTGVGSIATPLTSSITVNPTANPSLGFTIDATTPRAGGTTGTTTLTWSVPQGTSCAASGDWTGAKANHGSVDFTIPDTNQRIYALTCTNSFGTATKSAVVNQSSGGTTTGGGTTTSASTTTKKSLGAALGWMTLSPLLIVGLLRIRQMRIRC